MIVVDASVIVDALADRGDRGTRARQRLRAAGDDVAAPDVVDVEAFSGLRQLWLSGWLSDERFEQAVTDLAQVALYRLSSVALLARAFDLRHNLTAYDACYVALAEELECPLVTADARLAHAPGARCLVEPLDG